MDFWNWFNGLVQLRFIGADAPGSLSAISSAGISVFNSEFIDELTVKVCIQRTSYKKAYKILVSGGNEVEIVEQSGLYWKLMQLIKRPIFMFGMILLAALNIYLPGRILFIQVEGNIHVPSRKILEVVAENGLGFGSLRRDIRSEQIKNKLLESIPELQWGGVNTRGCVAIISVRERQTPKESSNDNTVSSIVASRDGVIYECTATKGNLLCKVGQAVKTGEVLISGYTDCGLKIQATKAEGEVFAKTERDLTTCYPSEWQQITGNEESIEKISLKIGKKRINLYNGSGISHLSCGKMYKEMYVTLPGGFILPIAIVKEIWLPYKLSDAVIPQEAAYGVLSDSANKYILSQMIAGEIISADVSLCESNGTYQLQGKYACLEMIGQTRKEEIYG